MRQGFTLIEMLVAAVLLGMLVTVLTMVFNSSSVAWRTGTAGVALLNDTRRQIGGFHDIRDDVLPGLQDGDAKASARKLVYRTVSLWQKNSDSLRTDRAWDRVSTYDRTTVPFSMTDAQKGSRRSLQGGQTTGGSLFTVGVRSAGPNRKYGDADDITTWPDDVF